MTVFGFSDLAFMGAAAGYAMTDADAAAYVARVEGATGDNQALEPGVRRAIDEFVIGCKADGIWNAIKASCIMAGARTLAGALVPLVGAAPTNFNFVSGDYNRKTGLVGDGSTKYLNSNRAGNADPQNSNHHSCFVSTAASSATGIFPVYIGNSGGPGDRNIYRDQNNGVVAIRCNGFGLALNSGNILGFIGVRRSSATSTVARSNGSSASYTANSTAPNVESLGVFAAAQTNRSITYANARLAFYSIGESLDLALLDARVTTLINAFAAAIP